MHIGSVLGVAILTGGAAAPAPPLNMQDRQVLQAVGVLIAVDHLRSQCASADRPPLADRVRAWDTAGGATLRTAVIAARRDAKMDAIYREMERGIAAALAPHAEQACSLLASSLGTPPPSAPGATGHSLTDGVSPPAPAGRSNTSPPPPAAARSGPGIAAFGMLLNYGMGYGGMMVASYDPIVLFQDGSILTDIQGLADPAADRRAHPDHWSRWRQTSGRTEYLTRGGQWHVIPEEQVWKSPPNAARLTGRFTHVGGGGNIALGGTSAVLAQTSYEFLPSGRLTREGIASASSEAGTTRTVTGSASGAHTGRYSVSGFMIDVRYDDGQRETIVLMTHPRDPNIIWLDGTSYTRKK